jgi:hypothetical protein
VIVGAKPTMAYISMVPSIQILLTYNRNLSDNYSLNFNYTPDGPQGQTTLGVGTVGLDMPPQLDASPGNGLNPYAQAIFQQVAQQTAPVREGLNCAPGAALNGVGNFLGASPSPGLNNAISAAHSGAQAALTAGGAERAAAVTGRAARVLGPEVAAVAEGMALKTAEKAVPFLAYAQGAYAAHSVVNYFQGSYATAE